MPCRGGHAIGLRQSRRPSSPTGHSHALEVVGGFEDVNVIVNGI